jgi:DNA-binding beta-propeller fold protein YncE
MNIVLRTGVFAASSFAVCLVCGCSGGNPSFFQQPRPVNPAAKSLLAHLNTLTTIGSAVDPVSGDQNPYGLAIAPVSSGLVTAGDLIICDFNDGPTNTQGDGESIVGLHPAPGSAPYRIAHDPTLLGCGAVAPNPTNDFVWATAFNANDVAIFGPNGSDVATLTTPTFPWNHPWGQIFGTSAAGVSAFYVSNASDGSVDRVAVTSSGLGATTVIATGFSINSGAPGSILAPSGLTYDPAKDVLYVVDGNANTVSAIPNASTISSAVSASSLHVIASGPPLNGPISSALLPDGDLVVGNTLDAAGTNLLIEVSPAAGVVATKNVDTGAAGALFGIVVTGTLANPKIYFNDDNTNTVVLLSH